MARPLSDEDRRILAQTLKRVGLNWQAMFREGDYDSSNYFDLFTEIWLRQGEPVYKTDCYRFMPGISTQTAKKYLQHAITRGYLRESDNPQDGRSKLITMSLDLKAVMEQSYDHTAQELRKALNGRPPAKA
jgi:hypothetical protein